MVNLPSARTLSAKLLGRWEREKDTYVLVVGVKADVYLDFEGPAPKLHEYRALFYSESGCRRYCKSDLDSPISETYSKLVCSS